MNEPKRHHWWPQTHQRFWTNLNSKIVTLDRSGKLFTPPTEGVAVIRHHNSFIMPDGTRNAAPEKMLGQNVDSNIRRVLEKIADQGRRTVIPALKRMTPSELQAHNERTVQFGFEPLVNFEYVTLLRDDRVALAKYVASMIVRVPPFRGRLSAVFRAMMQALERKGIKVDNINGADHNQQIDWMIKNLPVFAKSIAAWTWVMIKSTPSENFIFSDNPVSLNTPHGLNGGLSDLVIPLLPNLAFCALDGPKNEVREGVHVIQANLMGTKRYNRITIGNARDQLFFHDTPSDAMRAYCLENFGRPTDKDILLEPNGRDVKVSKLG
jgi:hypothetical protein